MIELRTGIPGSGKTLSMVSRLAALFKRWEVHPQEARPVFVHNIKGLKFPVTAMPLTQFQRKSSEPIRWVPDWSAMPDGSLVLIDECQGNMEPNKDGQLELLFPPRSSASEAPPHVSWLNTHRHHGFDIWLTTQNPKLIDITARSLVGKHQHFRRLFGGNRSMIYEWDACSDSLTGMKTAVISYFSFPKNAYEWYKSAEIHTKQSFKLPKWLLIPFAGIALGAFFLPKAFGILTNGISGKGINGAPVVIAPAAKPVVQPQATQAKGGAIAPTVAQPSVDYTKPFKDDTDEPDRPISVLKRSHGVYTDDDQLVPHFSSSELAKQKRNSQLLDVQISDFESQIRVANSRSRSPIIYNEREKIGSYSF